MCPASVSKQREFSLVAVTTGGFLFGAATRSKGSGAESSAWTGIFYAIWAPWVGMFGFYPLYVRQPDDLTPLVQNALVFAVCLGVTWFSPVWGGEVSLPSISSLTRSSSGKGGGGDGGGGDGEKKEL